MRIVLLSVLLFAAWVCCMPAGGDAVADLSEYISPGRAAWRSYLSTLSTSPPPALRHATPAELADIEQATYVPHPSVVKLGIFEPGHAFIGETPAGRLVFHAPHIHGITMHVPAKGHLLADQLTAFDRDGAIEVRNLGPVQATGWGPEDLHNIAVKTPGAYVVRDDVPMNRVAWTKQRGNWEASSAS